jgi:hypothetical protein
MRFETVCDNSLGKLAVFEAKMVELLPWQQLDTNTHKKRKSVRFETVCDNSLSK